MSKRGDNWKLFSEQVHNHIEKYTVPQYGDAGEDLATEYTSTECVKQAQKYLSRFGRNSRPGQESLDLQKAAHYCQLASEKLEQEKANAIS